MEEIESGRATVAAVVGLGARNQPPPRQAHVRRRFTEIDLRRMLEYANGYHRDIVQGRWVILTTYQRSRWEVIVEPDFDSQLLVVVVTLQQRGTMKDSYLEVTFRRGRPLAAYY